MKQISKPIRVAIQTIAMIFAVSAPFAHAQESANAEALNSIQSVSASNEAGKVVLTVSLKSPLTGLPTSFAINTPPRIAFDFPNTENGLGKSTQEFGEGDLRSANIVQAGNRTRLVVNLSQMLGYETRMEGNNLLITMQRKGGGAVPAHFAEAKTEMQQKHALRDIDFRRGKNGEGRVVIDLSDTNIGIDIKQQGRKLLVDFQNTSLPGNLQRKLDVTDFGTPVQLVDAFAQGGATRLSIEPTGLWEYSAYQTDNKFIIEIKRVVEDPNKLVKSTQTGYSGDKLTLNFQNISVREALSVIADFTGLNMVISDTVSGNLTLRLKDVPWDQALDIILQSKGLDRRKNGNVIQVAPREEIATKEKLDLTARQEIGELEPVRTESFQLSFAKALEMATLLKSKDAGLLSTRGRAVSDLRTNTLFVQDTPSRLDDIRAFVKQLDIPVRQVLIEARFVEAGDSFSRTLGGKVGYAGPETTVAGGGYPIAGNVRGATNGIVNLPGFASGTGGVSLSLFNQAATKVLTLELNASELDGTTKNIASPRVLTGDKTPATIEQGVQIPYQVATASGATSIAFANAVLGLTVTPQITPEDRVGMKLLVHQDSVGAIYGTGAAAVPSINTKKVDTQVLVDNGGTVVIGGIYTQDDSDSKTQVPLLGDIPILGWLFKNDTKTKAKRELLVFITPKILKESLGME